MDYCDTCKLDTNHGGYDFCPTETKRKLDETVLQLGEARRIVGNWDDCGAVEALGQLDKILNTQKSKEEGLRCDICQKVKPDTILRCHDCYMMT